MFAQLNLVEELAVVALGQQDLAVAMLNETVRSVHGVATPRVRHNAELVSQLL